jgi:hypothetical protein
VNGKIVARELDSGELLEENAKLRARLADAEDERERLASLVPRLTMALRLALWRERRLARIVRRFAGLG